MYRIKPNIQLPGSVSNAQPGTPSVPRLRFRASAGLGNMNAEAHELQKLFRTTPESQRGLPDVRSADDVTRGLGLERDQEEKIHRVLRVRQEPYKTFFQVSNILNHMGVASDIRMEVRRRIRSYQLRFADKEEPNMLLMVSKGLRKSKKNKKESLESNPANVPGGIPKEKDKEKKDKPKIKPKVSKTDEGHKISFGDVETHIPEDADFQHHATEYAKHNGMHQAFKEHDPDSAESHRLAANIHARIANALHQTGQTQPHSSRSMEDDVEEDEENEENEDAPLFGGDAIGNGKKSPGKDVSGKPIPAKPDKKRNEPVPDDQKDAARKVAKKKD